jgi:hypothetical protein
MLSAVLGLLTLRVRQPILFAVLALLCAAWAHAEPAPFDLAGPSLAVTVTRGQQTLPITQVPNLAPGDRLWIQADFPASQAAHYLMVAAFLRGATNPPRRAGSSSARHGLQSACRRV